MPLQYTGVPIWTYINTYGWGQVEVGKMFGIVTDHRKNPHTTMIGCVTK